MRVRLRRPGTGRELAIMVLLTGLLLLATAPRTPRLHAQEPDPASTRAWQPIAPFGAGESLLVASDAEASLELLSPGAGTASTGRRLATLGGVPSPEAAATDGHLRLHALEPSPDGRYIVVEGSTARAHVWLLDLADRRRPALAPLVPEGNGRFLGWHPDSRQLLYAASDDGVADPGLWLVDARDGSHRLIEIPHLVASEGLLSAAFSPDGRQIAYAVTRGLGFGSSLWLTDPAGKAHESRHEEAYGVISGLSWSPDGADLAYALLLDSPVPFTSAALWTLTLETGKRRHLAVMDGGHGERPHWSADGRTLYYVARDNLDEVAADRDPTRLVSSIRAVDRVTGKERIIVPADGAIHRDLRLTRDDDLLFASTRGGGPLQSWRATPTGTLTQLTTGPEARRLPLLLEPPK